ncbi:hypothetical protein ACWOAH_06210 [Vagococcus vulneris]|uniref:Uncharacterized protein n=1 Tax=Vagococcus vulneris TaxID=1977869 RepID=A0A429ZYU0_9ENTE|nr:hypothetical protein [Vagococcus vulneris]RST99159.1 hypothetical protein CBF37_05690 [Vagococcus vulneris]
MKTNDYMVEANLFFDMEQQETLKLIDDFQKSLNFRGLNYYEQQLTKEVILKVSEFMLNHHFQTIEEWESVALQETLVVSFPQCIVANTNFLNSVEGILATFFNYLYMSDRLPQGQVLIRELPTICSIMLEIFKEIQQNKLNDYLFV